MYAFMYVRIYVCMYVYVKLICVVNLHYLNHSNVKQNNCEKIQNSEKNALQYCVNCIKDTLDVLR